ncbi:MAG: hypothetical protein NC485_14065 [Ruminococcus flavefaciens]|nr:hypothetical protein [Ruminococcus flavefaciens]MCM1061898.1 hypothetical protein [Eubacterium sp.]
MDEIVVVLLRVEYETDSLKKQKKNIVSRHEVFGTKKSVGANEFFKSGQLGIRSQYQVLVHTYEYDGETLVEINGKNHSVYRTYERTDGFTELYLEERSGL